MGKTKRVYVCSECGYTSLKWEGRCSGCEQWNTMQEELTVEKKSSSLRKARPGEALHNSGVKTLKEVDDISEIRYTTGLGELDRVLGGGIVRGSLVLIGGDPGIGKSTILLQICEYLGQTKTVLYVSGEESQKQIKLRAGRLNVTTENLILSADTNVESIINTIVIEKPDIVIIDSIQTMVLDELSSSAGSITQVRESTNAFMRLAKSIDIPILIVGHVNKDGAIAGPKVLEHIVDVVLHFEGERHQNYRILRAVKNRFGSTNEIGVFDMSTKGLIEVENPSMMLLSGRPSGVSGTCVSCVIEGSRPILAEVQGLVTKTSFGIPRRTSTGFDFNRMAIIIAVLEKRVGFHFGSLDAYVNVVGGLRLMEPSADLAVALSLVSSLIDVPIGDGIAAFGEVGLAGEIRSVTHIEQRLTEISRLGFNKCILPKSSLDKLTEKSFGNLELIGVSSISQAAAIIRKK